MAGTFILGIEVTAGGSADELGISEKRKSRWERYVCMQYKFFLDDQHFFPLVLSSCRCRLMSSRHLEVWLTHVYGIVGKLTGISHTFSPTKSITAEPWELPTYDEFVLGKLWVTISFKDGWSSSQPIFILNIFETQLLNFNI